MKRLLLAVLILTSTLAVYLGLIRRWLLTWGATREETQESLPGDDIVREPHFIATRAVTIAAPPSEVWNQICRDKSGDGGADRETVRDHEHRHHA